MAITKRGTILAATAKGTMLLKFSLLFFYILIAFPPQSGKAAWWERTTVYEVYPRSLQDSDGDGTGDLNGIRSRLDYFADLGVETLWLTPIFESPMRDNGYDISNYLMIDPLFGTMEDFEQLVVEAHQKGNRSVEVLFQQCFSKQFFRSENCPRLCSQPLKRPARVVSEVTTSRVPVFGLLRVGRSKRFR